MGEGGGTSGRVYFEERRQGGEGRGRDEAGGREQERGFYGIVKGLARYVVMVEGIHIYFQGPQWTEGYLCGRDQGASSSGCMGNIC